MKIFFAFLLEAGLLFPLGFSAERPLLAAEVVEIKISHIQRLISEVGDSGCCNSSGKGLDASPTFSARKNSTVRISIVDANPLLFQYTLKKGDAVQTANAKALAAFTDSLDAFVSGLGGSMKSAAALASASLQNKAREAAASPATEAPPRTLDCDTAINALVEVGTQLDSFAKLRTSISNQSLTDHAGVKRIVAAWNLESWSAKLKAANEGLDNLTGQLLPAPRSGEEEQCRSVVALASVQAAKIGKVLDSLNDFAKLVGQIDDPLTLPAFTVNISEDQPIEIKITKSENFPAGMSEKPLFIGDTTFTVSPLSRVTITPGAAAVYSFVRAPTFSAVSSGGQFVIKQTKNDYNKLDGAVMMQIEPDAWDLGPVGMGVQLGVSPKTDVGLFLGLSLRATGFFTLGAGVAFQREDQLAQGLALGQVIASQDLLKTEKTFRSGLYLNITVTTQKK